MQRALVARNTLTQRQLLALRLRYARAHGTHENHQAIDAPGLIQERDPADYTRPHVDPNAQRRRPPPTRRVDPPPPAGAWPKIETLQQSVWGTVENAANKAFVGIEFGASGPISGKGQAVLNLPAGMVHEGLVFQDCRFKALGGDDCNMLWGLRGFDLLAPTFRRVEFDGPFWEHGCYLGAPQGLTMEYVRFIRNCAAGYQEAHRWWLPNYTQETILPLAGLTPSVSRFYKVHFIECGNPKSERFQAFTFSLHPNQVYTEDGTFYPDSGEDVQMVECLFTGGHFEFNYAAEFWRSNRSFMVGNRRAFRMIDCIVDTPQPVHRWIGQTHNTKEVELVRSTYIGGDTSPLGPSKAKIEIKNPERVRIEGCQGDVWVRVGKGPGIGEGITDLIYEGPITQDYFYNAG